LFKAGEAQVQVKTEMTLKSVISVLIIKRINPFVLPNADQVSTAGFCSTE
jgi:hypothetical protein